MESIESYVEEDNEVRIIGLIINKMDIASLGFKPHNNETTDIPEFDQKYLLEQYIYGCFNGIRSSCKLAKQCEINIKVIWSIKYIKPKYKIIIDFRKDNIDSL